VFLAGIFKTRQVERWLNQAATFARPSDEVALLAAAKNLSLARLRRSRWARACSEVTRG